MTQRTINPRRTAGAAAALVLLAAAASALPNRPQALPADAQGLAGVVIAETDAARRAAAAGRLADAAPTLQGLAAITEVLRATDPAPRRLMLAALARVPNLSPGCLRPLSTLAEAASPEELPEVLGAIGSIHTPEAAAALVPFAADSRPDAVRAAALAALTRLTGREEPSVAAWEGWLREASGWSREQWESELARAQAVRADRAAEAQRSAIARLIETTRKLHLATPPDGQGPLLAGLLGESVPELRALGFELITRELAAGTRLDGKVGRAVIPLLSDPDPKIRERSAQLVNQLVPDGAEQVVKGALEREAEPAAAAAFLAAASRWPTEDLAEPALRWLGSPSTAARPAAAQLLLAMLRAGNLDAPAHREEACAILRARPVESLSPPKVRLLSLLGTEEDRDRLGTLLECQDASLRLAAAESLAGWARFLPAILDAAALDPALFEVAGRAVILHAPDSVSFRILAKLPAAAPEVRRRTLAGVARLMPAADVLEVANDADADPGYHEMVLSQLAFEDRVMAEGVDPANARAFRLGLPRLARLRIDAGRYDAALAALAPLSELPGGEDEPAAVEARTVALLSLGRIEQAVALPASSWPWLEAMERMENRETLRKIADAFTAVFPPPLPPDDAVRWQAILARLESAPRSASEPRPGDR